MSIYIYIYIVVFVLGATPCGKITIAKCMCSKKSHTQSHMSVQTYHSFNLNPICENLHLGIRTHSMLVSLRKRCATNPPALVYFIVLIFSNLSTVSLMVYFLY